MKEPAALLIISKRRNGIPGKVRSPIQ